MNKTYDVIIVGAGPAGIFAALELTSNNPSIRILMIEKGSDIYQRRCPMMDNAKSCLACRECSIVSGWGGAGAFSDGKLSLSPDVGGYLERYISRSELESLIEYVDGIYVRYGAPLEVFGGNEEEISRINERASGVGLDFVPCRVRHIGTDRCLGVLKEMEKALNGKVDVLFHSPVSEVLVGSSDGGRHVRGIELDDGTRYSADNVIIASGREGSSWLEGLTRRLKLKTLRNPVDIGVRVELPAYVLEPLTRSTYEPKLIYRSKSFDDRVRTFCVNPYGEVVKEHLDGLWTVNGHSYADRRTENTNFALLVSSTFTEPFDKPISYGRHIAELANFLGKGILVQRLGDLRAGRRSTVDRLSKGRVRPSLKDAAAGDLSFALPFRHMTDILEMLEALDSIAPGVNSDDTLLYGVEVKFYSLQLSLSGSLQTEIHGLYAVGDGAGVSRGLIQASVSGVVSARSILSD